MNRIEVVETIAAVILVFFIGVFIGHSDNDEELAHYKACVSRQATKEECDAIWWVREKYISAKTRPHS